jgi:hypothetical protein
MQACTATAKNQNADAKPASVIHAIAKPAIVRNVLVNPAKKVKKVKNLNKNLRGARASRIFSDLGSLTLIHRMKNVDGTRSLSNHLLNSSPD